MTAVEPSKVALKKEDKRQRLLRAALELFAERGFHGTAVPLVAERAGVAAGTVYRFFESKEELVNEVFRDAKGRLRHVLTDGLDLTLPPKALFDDFWARLVAFARAEPIAFHFLELQDHAPYLDDRSRSLEREVLTPIFLAVSRFHAEGVLRTDVPVDATMAFIWGAFVGLMKAERHGYLTLGDDTLAASRDACFRAFAVKHRK
ncbi:Transcriptional regulator, TetR family protein [Minicystis rosea]|nr:Transcriptional regulator, TetR family protein [Minicystis rosea]